MTTVQHLRMASDGGDAQPMVVSDETSLKHQLARYAEDFQELQGRYGDLERRHALLRASYQRLSEAGAILGRESIVPKALCLVLGPDGRLEGFNAAARTALQLGEAGPVQVEQLLASSCLPQLQRMLEGLSGADRVCAAAELVMHPQGDPASARLFSVQVLPLLAESQRRLAWVMRDIGAADSPHAAAEIARKLHRGALLCDASGLVIAADHDLAVVGADEGLPARLSDFLPSVQAGDGFEPSMWTALQREGYWRGQTTLLAGAHAEPVCVSVCVSAIAGADNSPPIFVAVFSDHAALRGAELALMDTSSHDPLTGLPQRALFDQRVAQRIAAARCGGESVAMLSVLLDRMQWIRDTEDVGVAETVLHGAVARLQESVRGCDSVASAGADCFAVLLVGLRSEAELALVAQRMIDLMGQPFALRKLSLVVGASIGGAMFRGDGVDGATLLASAADAMALARKAGSGRYRSASQPLAA